MTVSGSCYCGATQFELDITPERATRCTCRFCTKRGALWTYCGPDQFRLLTPKDAGARYNPSGMNHHHFCPTCGCATYSDTPDWVTEPFDPQRRRIAVSAHLLDDFDIAALPVETVDGKNQW